jgi:tyrosyl-tRNA synthetase
MSKEEVLKNAATYKKQVSKILNPDKLKIVFNSEWFAKMSALEFAELLTHYTATRMLERDDFVKRRQEGRPIYMSEFIYPILQGYDSVKLEADIELGGTDQVFNLLVGRDIQRDFGQPEQVVITMPLLEGTDGVQKMSKSLGNYIGINEAPDDIFGKTMSISDELMFKYYTLLTDCDLDAVRNMHPKEAKLELAEYITTQYHGQELARKARDSFEQVFSRKDLPQHIPIYRLKDKQATVVAILVDSNLVKSKNEARRLIMQGGVYLDGIRIEKEDAVINREGILKVGKRKFLKIIINRGAKKELGNE